ncbi:MAG: oxygen-dependent tRNA uridine(34) hydroxylase TrhO [Candidatus Nucleicultricaceae bacterium]
MRKITVAALYKFADFPNFKEHQESIKAVCKENKILGTLLLAHEGINGTIAGPDSGVDALIAHLHSIPQFKDLEYKKSYVDDYPFYRLKVRLKKEIVTLGVEGLQPGTKTGHYVAPQDWNDLISSPDVILIDTRNDYEVKVGTFKGAVNPETESFREFSNYVLDNPDLFKNRRIAMFCTGGIRCEKASAFMMHHGYDDVYQLKGGILKYIEEVPQDESLWEGECFVFDNRVSVTNGVEPGHFDLCHGCRAPITEEVKSSPHYENGVSCPECYDKKSEKKLKALRERQRQIALAKSRNQRHLGVRPS